MYDNDNNTLNATCVGITTKGKRCKNKGKYKNFTEGNVVANDLFCNLHVSSSDELCAICMSALYDVYMLYCGHLYHTECIQKWMTYTKNCPICRCIIYDDNVPHMSTLCINNIYANVDIDIMYHPI